MREHIKHIFLAGLLILGMCLGLTGCSARIHSSFDSPCDIRIGRVKYDAGMSALVLYTYQQIYEDNYHTEQSIGLWNRTVGANQLSWEYVRDNLVLEEFCCVAALSQMAQERGIPLSDQDRDKIQAAAEEYYKTFSYRGFGTETISQDHVEQVLQMYRSAELCVAELIKGISPEISDDEVRVIEVTILQTENESQATVLHGLLEEGETVEYIIGTNEFVTAYSEILRRADTAEALETVAFQLKTGEYSDPVLIEDHWTVVFCDSDYDAALTEENRMAVLEDRRTQAWTPAYQSWIKNAGLYIDQNKWEQYQPLEKIGEQEDLFSVYRRLFP